ncbi:MAG: phosphatidylserine/phosphatidylglycerophosphate/cardiolipin synthase family protein, partial [Halobacteriovoraceae bacterium]|nr:phosphatidylserine/phosphatidylglycerophosphate/cardiolipin synthase family protein [Halobacteriovoraceae bacterium]
KKEGSIDVHYYSIGNDRIAHTELGLLRKAAREGVNVRMVIDGLATYSGKKSENKYNSKHIKGILKELVKNGVQIKTHNPPYLMPIKLNNRNHNKILKLSQSVIIGDRNLRHENYDTNANNENSLIGFDIIVKGDILTQMRIYLDQFWESHKLRKERFSGISEHYEKWGRERLDEIEKENFLNLFSSSPKDINDMYNQLNEEFVKPDYLEWIFDRDNNSKNIKIKSLSSMDKIISAIYRARESIKIISPYMVLTNRMKYALKHAMKKNVHVEFASNGTEESMIFLNKIMSAGYIYESKKYCDLGIEMKEIQNNSKKKIHAKVVIIDGRTVFISSNNWNHHSQSFNVEVGVRIDDEIIAQNVLDWYERLPLTPISQGPCLLNIEVILFKLLKFIL